MADLGNAIQNIWSSDYVQKNPSKAYKVTYAEEYVLVAQYVNGGARPDPANFSKLGKGLVEAEDVRRSLVEPEPEPVPTPISTAFDFPASFHLWGNAPSAYSTHDFVVSNQMKVSPSAAQRQANPKLVAVVVSCLDPENSNWALTRGHHLTYGSGIMGGGNYSTPWGGTNDTLSPNAQGPIRGWLETDYLHTSTGELSRYRGNPDGGAHPGIDVSRVETATFLKRAMYWAWKNGVLAKARSFNGIWSDNLLFDMIRAGWAFPDSTAAANLPAWNDGMADVCEYLRANGIPLVGGNIAHRTSDPRCRKSTNVALHETLEATISQGAGPFSGSSAGYAYMLNEATLWQKADSGPRYFVFMHKIASSDAAGMRFGLALATIAGGAYMPYQSHSDLYMPAEMRKNGQRHYLGKPVAEATRSGNTWSRRFEHGTVSANYDTKQGTFS